MHAISPVLTASHRVKGRANSTGFKISEGQNKVQWKKHNEITFEKTSYFVPEGLNAISSTFSLEILYALKRSGLENEVEFHLVLHRRVSREKKSIKLHLNHREQSRKR